MTLCFRLVPILRSRKGKESANPKSTKDSKERADSKTQRGRRRSGQTDWREGGATTTATSSRDNKKDTVLDCCHKCSGQKSDTAEEDREQAQVNKSNTQCIGEVGEGSSQTPGVRTVNNCTHISSSCSRSPHRLTSHQQPPQLHPPSSHHSIPSGAAACASQSQSRSPSPSITATRLGMSSHYHNHFPTY